MDTDRNKGSRQERQCKYRHSFHGSTVDAHSFADSNRHLAVALMYEIECLGPDQRSKAVLSRESPN